MFCIKITGRFGFPETNLIWYLLIAKTEKNYISILLIETILLEIFLKQRWDYSIRELLLVWDLVHFKALYLEF